MNESIKRVEPVPCPVCGSPVLVRVSGDIVAHYDGDGNKCRANEKSVAHAKVIGERHSKERAALEALAAAKSTGIEASAERAVIIAYIRDRIEQYRNDSCCRVALEDIAGALRDGEHLAAHAHGELDDLLKRPLR